MNLLLCLVLLMLGLATNACGNDQRGDVSTTQNQSKIVWPRYNEIRTKTTHNSYEKDLTLFDQLAGLGLRSIELDLKANERKDGKWEVYHTIKNPITNSAFGKTDCQDFSSCLQQIRWFHEAFPNHEVITIFMDLGDDFQSAFDNTHTPAQLNATLRHDLSGFLFAPEDLYALCPHATSLRETVTKGCAWPRLDSLKGRVMVVFTNDALCKSNGRFRHYLSSVSPAAFVAPELNGDCRFTQVKDPYENSFLFFNLNFNDKNRALLLDDIQKQGLISRVFVLNEEQDWRDAVLSSVNFFATDILDTRKNPWASTAARSGWPFSSLVHGPESPAWIEQNASSFVRNVQGCPGPENGFFALDPFPAGLGGENASGSFFMETLLWPVEPLEGSMSEARGCLAITSEVPSNIQAKPALFAVCHATASEQPAEALVRREEEAPVEVHVASDRDFTRQKCPLLRLRVQPGTNGVSVTGDVSTNGVDWNEVHRETFPRNANFHWQGISLFSADGSSASFAFARMRRSTTRDIEPYQPSWYRHVGSSAPCRVF